MRTPKRIARRDGTEAWQVRYRLAGANRCQTIDGEDLAAEFCTWLSRYDASRAEDLLMAAWPRTRTGPRCRRSTSGPIAMSAPARRRPRGPRQMPQAGFGKRFGDLPVDRLTPEDIATAIIEMSEDEGLADKTIANRHGILTGMMKTAQNRGLITVNPCSETSLPDNTSHESAEAGAGIRRGEAEAPDRSRCAQSRRCRCDSGSLRARGHARRRSHAAVASLALGLAPSCARGSASRCRASGTPAQRMDCA